MISYCICYNITQHTIAEIPFLPEAYIASLKNDQPDYIEKQATETTIPGFDLNITETPHEQLVEICSLLKPSVLEQKFTYKKGRKKLTLPLLLQDPKTKEVISNYINTKLNTFYQLISENQYYLTYNTKRKEPIPPNLIKTPQSPLQPILNFVKTDDGIEYAFSLQDQNTTYIPKDHTIDILLNTPSWILLNKNLFQIQGLNANKLKPFLTKEKITIQQKHLKTYLEKVIIPVIKNVEVRAEGFDIITKQTIHSFGIEIVQDFIQNIYVAKVIFGYDEVYFDYNQTKTSSSKVDFDGQQVSIIQIKRDENAEKKLVEKLLEKGLTINQNLFFENPENPSDPLGMIDWLKTNHKALEKEGFTIKTPLLFDKDVSLDSHSVVFEQQKKNDWFDIKGVVTVGQQEIPFSQFIPYIKKNERNFTLANDKIFIIPLEWMSKYKKLANFGKVEKDKVLLNKSNYTVLKEVLPERSIDLNIDDTDSFEYTPSPNLLATLRPYQLEGVKWLVTHYQNGLGACLADDMGLGKTLQTIAALVYTKEQLQPSEDSAQKIKLDLFSNPLEVKTFLKALIVLPASLVFNWAHEIIKFAPHLNIVKYTGAERKKTTPYLESYDIVLTTYTTLSRDFKALQKMNFNYLIIDESQQIKNKDSKIFQAINQINTVHKISLSGTPIENSLSDLWSQMQFINPGILGSFSFFKDHFKTPIEKHQSQEKIEELKSLIDPFILRRTKEQVAKDLPALTEQVMYTEMESEQEKLYESEKSAARNMLLGIDGPSKNKIHVLNTLTKLRQLANHPLLLGKDVEQSSGKFEDVTAYLQTLIKARKKVLIFSSFVSHLELYEKWCKIHNVSFLTLTGQTNPNDRESIVRHFQEDESIQLFFISLKAGGVGLNLTEASYVILLDPWWNPFIEKQAIARAHRIGQTNKVMVTRFIAKNTIEEKILQLQEKKKILSNDLIKTKEVPEYIEDALDDLLK